MTRRLIATLSCGHAVALEVADKPAIGSREWCPACGDSHVIVRLKDFLDEDVA